jgi:hypothetical protein
VGCFSGKSWALSYAKLKTTNNVQYEWGSPHNIAPLIIGLVFIIAFFVWEVKGAPYPMVPRALFSKAKKTMIVILLITFLSGGNFFVLLLLWPTEIYNVYGMSCFVVSTLTKY